MSNQEQTAQEAPPAPNTGGGGAEALTPPAPSPASGRRGAGEEHLVGAHCYAPSVGNAPSPPVPSAPPPPVLGAGGASLTVAVAGARGRMGREVVEAVGGASDLMLVGEADLGDDLAALLARTKPTALVDFTVPESALGNIETALAHGVVPIVGTTGLGPSEVDHVRDLCRTHKMGALIAPNFAIGAVLMMRFAQEAARYMPDAEIIEMHHERKLDAPSGTAAKTAEMIAAGRAGASPAALPPEAFEKIAGSRGGKGVGDVPIHSVRLPGFVASQMIIFGGLGQTLTIRHDSIDRKSFMPGVLLAVRHAPQLSANGGELVYGLENLL